MKISDIIPYERNARDNSENIPKIADSISQFGFIGQIVLESEENPVIVAGHHRVEACKLLGWEEIPDENICFCDGLSEDEIKALRLADNRLHEGGRWNRSLVRTEVASIAKKLDMSKFGFDFKSKIKPYGAERLRTDDYYNLSLINAYHCDKNGMPRLKSCNFVPKSLLGFNYAKSSEKTDCGIHFFIDDYQFERLWNKPDQYLDLLSKFECVLTPDFSLYMDMPLPMQAWNEYRRRALGAYWQRNGLTVIPTLSWSDKRSYGFCFDGLPKHSTYATSTVGVKNDEVAMKVWFDGMKAAIKKLQPKRILLYGGNIGFDFGCEVVEFKANTAFKE